jgi:hypothetical protein
LSRSLAGWNKNFFLPEKTAYTMGKAELCIPAIQGGPDGMRLTAAYLPNLLLNLLRGKESASRSSMK